MTERLNRHKVAERGAKLADEIGLEQLTLTKLGRELNVTTPGLYRHVSDIDDLRSAIGQLATEQLASDLALSSTGLSGEPALLAICIALRNWAKEYPGRYAALQIAPDPLQENESAAAQKLIQTIVNAIQSYNLAGKDLTDAIRFIRSTVHGFVLLEQTGGFKLERDLELSFHRIIGAIHASLLNW